MKKEYKADSEVKHFTFTQKILTFVLVILIIFGVITKFNQGNDILSKGYDTVSMLRYTLLDGPIKSVQKFSDTLGGYKDLAEENAELRAKLANTKSYKARYEDTRSKIKELEALMKLDLNDNYSPEYANVINRDIQGINSVITLNRGKKDGVKPGNVVVNSDGVLGKVISADSDLCKVQLLNAANLDSGVSVKVELPDHKFVFGILDSYDQDKNLYRVQIYDSNAQIKKDSKVLSSGEGGVYPSGLIVGNVDKLEDIYSSNGKTIYVKPSVNFNSLEHVAILKENK